MNKALKLIPVGNSTGVVIPREVLERLRVQKGDTLYLTESAGGGFRVTAYDPDFAYQMELGEQIMREDRDILRVLAQ